MSFSFPREVLKWIQGMNLENSFSDYRRDLSNGYVMAQIIDRYNREVLMLHSFQNSQKSTAKENNWVLLTRVFAKIGFETDVSTQAVSEGKLDEAIKLISQLYTFLTKKPIQLQKRVIIKKTQKTYLLTEAGIEPFEPGKTKAEPLPVGVVPMPEPEPMPEEQNQTANSNFSLSPVELGQIVNPVHSERLDAKENKSQRPASTSSSYIKSTNNIAQARSAAKQVPKKIVASTLTEYKQVFEKLNDHIARIGEKLDTEFISSLPPAPMLYYAFSQNAHSVSEKFIDLLLDSLAAEQEEILKLIAKDSNDSLKFTVFFLNLITCLQEGHPSLSAILNFCEMIISKLTASEFEAVFYLLKHFVLGTLIEMHKKFPEKSASLVKFLGFCVPKKIESRKRIFELVLAQGLEKEILVLHSEMFISLETEKNEENKTYLKRLKSILRTLRPHDSFRTKLSCLRALTHIASFNSSFARKEFFAKRFLFRKKENITIQAQALSLMFVMAQSLFASEAYKDIVANKNKHGKFTGTAAQVNRERVSVSATIDLLIETLQDLVKEAVEQILVVFLILFFDLTEHSKKLSDLFLSTLLSKRLLSFDSILNFGVEMTPSVSRVLKLMGIPTTFPKAQLESRSPSLLVLLIKIAGENNPDLSDDHTWKFLNYCFQNCRFEDINFENFDAMVNDIFNQLLDELKVFNPSRLKVIERIVVFHVKAEITLRDFELRIQSFLTSENWKPHFQKALKDIYAEHEDNDVFQLNLAKTFPTINFH